eukprot:scaffold54464_cov46-Attheya_sp.AAC.1
MNNAPTTRTSESPSRHEDKENAAPKTVTAEDAWKSAISMPQQQQHMTSRENSFQDEESNDNARPNVEMTTSRDDSCKDETIKEIPDIEMADTASCTDDLSCCENGLSSRERGADDKEITRPPFHVVEIMCPAPECETTPKKESS